MRCQVESKCSGTTSYTLDNLKISNQQLETVLVEEAAVKAVKREACPECPHRCPLVAAVTLDRIPC